ncbi:MAG: MoxR family ATPase [Candidatus Omnitrophica bacterium]|nr:MAG: ATPase family associated with various cellular activities (AAA) [Candidatus Hinthialibacteria bacterium OLB16]MCK6495025.1 AAA family ATPase [bacterium]MCL4734274.1 MoxR family ATPase [Candidatus Omnitrophota bacterium]NUP92725.1 AAA family ATPase [Candidatus Omnitrophota bacterium]
MNVDIKQLTEEIREKSAFVSELFNEIEKVIVGQRYMVERLLIGLLTRGHCLLEGVPGLAKTLTVTSLSKTIQASFNRIQFTPDLLPADLTGTLIYNQQTSQFTCQKGPVFANIILADEVNRAPAKVQSALLESMQERQVTIGGATYPLPEPFLVLATQNPIEQEGTYPLPEAQVDRFMLKLKVGYPSREEELAILDRMTGQDLPSVSSVVSLAQVASAQEIVRNIYIDEKVRRYIVDIVHATRTPQLYDLNLNEYIAFGASPRASIYLTLAAKAHAFIRGRGYATPEDVKSIGMDVLRHRVILTYEAEAEEMKPEDVIQKVFDKIEVP